MDGEWRVNVDTEKITINLGAVDLGQIDLLVEQGFYSNRTDFIRTAIRNHLSEHSSDVKGFLKPQYMETDIFTTMGVVKLGVTDLEELKSSSAKVNIKMVGMLIIDNDVTVELARETIKNVKVYGIIRATDEVKKVILGK